MEPVVTAMVKAWSPPSQPNWARTADRVVAKVLDWLQNQRGDDWQTRWLASEADLYPRTWPALVGIEGRQQLDTANRVVNALIVLRAIVPALESLVGMPRLRLRDDWTIHHDVEVFASLRAKVEAADGADRADSIAHLYRLSVTTGRGLADLTGADFRVARETYVRLGKRKRNLDAAWRHLRQMGLLRGQPEELSQELAKARLTPRKLEMFLSQECTPFVRGLLEAAQADGGTIRKFEFNRFDVTLDLAAEEVVVADVFDAGQSGLLKMPLPAFFDALRGDAE